MACCSWPWAGTRSPSTDVWKGGFENGAWQDSAILMAPLLFIAAGLTVVFRASIWNLGYNGQYLLGAALAPATGRA